MSPNPLLHLVTGGARSGKSRYAQEAAEAVEGPLCFVATAQAFDADMAARIHRHRLDRGPRWRTIEEPAALAPCVREFPADATAVTVDCLTLWISNLLCAPEAAPDAAAHLTADHAAAAAADEAIQARIDELAAALAAVTVPTWVVTNEVGLGLVPADPLSRRYRDLLGRANQRVAAVSGRVTLLVAGLPLRVR